MKLLPPPRPVLKALPGALVVAREERVLRMPQLVAEAAIAYLFEAGYGLYLTSAVITGITVLSYAVVIGAYYAYGSYQAKQARDAARSSFNASLKDRLVMTATTDAPRSRCYGRVRTVDGVLFKNTHGPLSQYYTLVIALAGHEIDAVEQVWFNDVPLTLDGAGLVQNSPWAFDDLTSGVAAVGSASGGAGSVTISGGPVVAGTVSAYQQLGGDSQPVTAPTVTLVGNVISYSGLDPANDVYPIYVNYQQTKQTRNAKITVYRGAPGQDLSGALIALGCPDATANHKFQGIACLLVTLTYSVDSFPSGIPNVTAVLRGAKVYDPRTGLTQWTRNASLIGRDWALCPVGGAALASEYDDVIGNASANACDVVQSFASDVYGTQSLPTYVCDLVAPTQTDPTPTLNEIVTAMAGKYAWCGGILRIKAGFYSAPVLTIDESFLSGASSIDITAGVARNDLVNSYRPTIADAAKGYVASPTAAVRATAYITADGLELPRDITMMAVSDAVHAQHVCGAMLRDSRQALTVKLPLNLKGYPLEVFDTIAVILPRFGWASKLFEVLTWDFSMTGGVTITAKETAASIWTPSLLFEIGDNAPNTALPLPWSVPAPTGLALSSGGVALTDGSILVRVQATWTASTLESVRQSGSYELQYWPAADALPTGEWLIAPPASGDSTKLIFIGPKANTAYLFRLRAINSLGVRSPWSKQVLHIVDQAASVIPDWTDIAGRPQTFRVMTNGGNLGNIAPPPFGLSNGETGATIFGAGRSYMLVRIRRSDGAPTFQAQYDVYGAGAITGLGAAALAAALNATGADSIVVVYSFDEPQNLRLSAGLEAAMYRCGASRSVFGSPLFKSRSAYVLIAIGGCGEGQGFEAYHGGIDNDPNAWVDVSFQLKGGNLIVTGSGATPGTLADYNYVGTLDATTDIALVPRGQCVIAGNYASKLGGSANWDSDVYSRDSATFACIASARRVTAAGLDRCMFGLNSDPQSDQSYTSLDYAWYFSGATATIYESGSPVIAPIVSGPDDVFAVIYDGSTVKHLQNGLLRRSLPVAAGQTLFWDSSFYDPGAAIRNIRFGALSANDWASIGNVNVVTSQVAANAITASFVAAPANVTVTAVGGTGAQNYSRTARWTPVASLSFVAPATGRGILSAFANVRFQGTASFPPRFYCTCLSYIDLNNDDLSDALAGDTENFGSIDFGEVNDGTTALDVKDTIGGVRKFDLVVGNTYTYNWFARKTEGTVTLTGIELRMDLFKK